MQTRLQEFGVSHLLVVLTGWLNRPLNLTRQHLDREEHGADDSVVRRHLFVDLRGAATLKLAEEFLSDDPAELLDASAADLAE